MIGEPGEVGEGNRACADRVRGRCRRHRPNRQRLDFGPTPAKQWHHRSIDAELLDGRARRWVWQCLLDLRDGGGLDGHLRLSGRFGQAADGGGTDAGPSEMRDQRWHLAERDEAA